VIEHEIFKSSVRSFGDLAGVFEFDGETGYFYLHDRTREPTQKIIDRVRILSFKPDFSDHDLLVRWDDSEKRVGLVIRRELLAVFDAQAKTRYGADYLPQARSTVPAEIALLFAG
jgi:hypothetical protein